MLRILPGNRRLRHAVAAGECLSPESRVGYGYRASYGYLIFPIATGSRTTGRFFVATMRLSCDGEILERGKGMCGEGGAPARVP
jgi:hypothetical protein